MLIYVEICSNQYGSKLELCGYALLFERNPNFKLNIVSAMLKF